MCQVNSIYLEGELVGRNRNEVGKKFKGISCRLLSGSGRFAKMLTFFKGKK